MADIWESAKNNTGILAVLGLVSALSGVDYYTEGNEDEEAEQMAVEFRQADVKQDERQYELEDEYHELDDRYHELDKKMALMQQQLCLMSQANIPNCQ